MASRIMRWITFSVLSVNLLYNMHIKLYSDLNVTIRQTDDTNRNDSINDGSTTGKGNITGFDKYKLWVDVSTTIKELIKLFKAI